MQTSRRISSFLSVAIFFLATRNSSLPAFSSTDAPRLSPASRFTTRGSPVGSRNGAILVGPVYPLLPVSSGSASLTEP